MSYIGRGTESISNVEVLDNLTFDGSASYTLQKSSTNFVPSSANNLLISISGVVQQGNFTVSGSTITFDTTVASSDTCDWILHYGTGLITTVADGAITEAKLGSNAVTTAKINNGAITSAKLDSGLALGKVLQIVQSQDTSQTAMSTTTYTDTGLSATITPSSTSSKVLVMWNNQGKVNTGTSNNIIGYIRTLRGSTEIGGASKFRQDGYVGESGYTLSYTYLDSPSTTSATTYKTQCKLGTSGDGRIFHDSIADGGMNPATWMTLIEIGA